MTVGEPMRGISLKIQIAVFALLLVTGLVTAFSWTVISIERRMILAEVIQRVILQGRNLALSSAKPLLHEDPEFELHPFVTQNLHAEKDIVSIVVVDRQGKIKGHRNVLSIDHVYEPTPGLRDITLSSPTSPGEEIRENDAVIEVKMPVTDQNQQLGFVYLQYSKAGVEAAMADIQWRMFRIGLLALVAGAVVSFLLALHITYPVNKLARGAAAIGEGRLDTRIKVRSAREIQTLAKTFNDMARRLKETRDALVEQERIQRELEIAREIQGTLLPKRLPHCPGIEMDAYYNAASEVGGDYFDIVPVDEDHLMIVVGDVAGKGVPGLVVMAMVRILVRALAREHESPADLLRHLNVLFRKEIKRSSFVTLFCGVLDTRKGTIIFANAAHMPLVVYRGAERAAEMLATTAKPIGIFPDETFSRGLENMRVDLRPGDCIVLYTDGLSEMRNASGEEYGIERLMNAVKREAASGSRHLVKELQSDLAAFRGKEPQGDDLTIVALHALPSSIEPAPGKLAPEEPVALERATR